MFKNFLSVKDVSNMDLLIQQAMMYKENRHTRATLGAGKKIGLLFFNPSMRTRLSTQIAASNLGMESIVYNIDKEGWKMEFVESAVMNGDAVEHIIDAAPVLGQYFDILGIRTFPGLMDREADYQETLLHYFKKYTGIPIISMESATVHPLQSLADILTIEEQLIHNPLAKKPKVVLTWAPHIKPLPQCVVNSFSQWVNAWGKSDFVITHPPGFELEKGFTEGAHITVNQKEALEDADFVYVKNWSSYENYGSMATGDMSEWMLTLDKLKATNNAKVMHCLPVRRNVELSDEVLDSNHSLVTQQAGNRVWSAQAVLSSMLENIL